MRLTQVRVLLVSLVSWQAVFGACPPGFFEKGCKLPCRCRTSKTCGPKGECPNNELCAYNYFGPGCQYVDSVAHYANPKPPSYLTDGDDSTCNPDTGQTELKVQFFGSFLSFFWFRIVARSSEHFKTFIFQYSRSRRIKRERRFPANSKTVDTLVETTFYMDDFTLKGPIVGQLCSLHISAGFNVALLGNATQTSNYEADLKKCGPHNAIDNNFSDKYEDNSCSATGVEKSPGPRWKLYLPFEVYMVNLHTYNRNIHQDRLFKHSVNLYTGKGQYLSYHGFQTVQSVYSTTDYHWKAAQSFEYFLDPSKTGDDRVLFLCEVEILVENVCPENRYGLTCSDTCTCDKSQICNALNGVCAQVCDNGYYGPTCNRPCSVKCVDKICEHVSGDCVKCPPGKTGRLCYQDAIVCTPGKYGPTCVDCSVGCSETTCDRLTGDCTCKSGFAGKNCSEKVCPGNKYGPTCSDTCTCDKSQKCHTLTGACIQICPVGFYGPTCTTACSEHCIDHICEHVSGNCIKCEPGYTGKMCDEECKPGTYGSSCRLNCSEGCTEACDKVTGHCDCKANFEGLDCSDCKGNNYGPNCDIPCSSSCLNSTCDPKTGKCLACRQNFTGELCKSCVAHYYGKMCEQMCPESCLNRTCDRVTGVCDSCPEGLTGPTCKDSVGALKFTPYWLLLLIPLALLWCCCLFLLLRRRRKREEPEDAGKLNPLGLTPNKKEGNNKEKPYRFNFYKLYKP